MPRGNSSEMWTPEMKAKISAAHKGREISAETRLKLKLTIQKQDGTWNRGKKLSRKKRRAFCKKRRATLEAKQKE